MSRKTKSTSDSKSEPAKPASSSAKSGRTAVKILGIGSTRSAGVRKGEIYDYSQARACLKDALAKAEDASDVEIGSVFLAITGAHIQGVNNRGTFRLPDGENPSSPRSMSRKPATSRATSTSPQDNVYIHHIIRGYYLDGLEHPHQPVGLLGTHHRGRFPHRPRHRQPHPEQHQTRPRNPARNR
jgi:cell division ATPase FtsA